MACKGRTKNLQAGSLGAVNFGVQKSQYLGGLKRFFY